MRPSGNNLPLTIEPLDDSKLRVDVVLPDLQGAPALQVRADMARAITAIGAETSNYALASVFIGGILLLLVTLLLMQSVVIGPITRLTKWTLAIGAADSLNEKIVVRHDDEIGVLASEYNSMLDRLSEATCQLQERSYHSGMAAMATGALHDVRNAINPLTLQVGRLAEQLRGRRDDSFGRAVEELGAADTPPERKAKLAAFLRLTQVQIAEQHHQLADELEDLRSQIGHIDDILLVHDEIGQTKQSFDPVPLDRVVADALAALPDWLTGYAEITVDPRLDDLDPVLASRVGLVQVIANLLRNALESIAASGRSDGRIEISAERRSRDGDAVICLSLHDNGEGIDPDKQQAVFQQGYTTRDGKGRGAGLHWCSHLIAGMHGRITADSQGPGRGATIVPRAAEGPAMSPPDPTTVRILAADDEPKILAEFEQVLTPGTSQGAADLDALRSELFETGPAEPITYRFELSQHPQGNAAVEAVARALAEGRPFQVAFLDVRMPPGIDGVDAAARIRALDPNIQIVVVTAYSDTHPSEIALAVPPADKLFYIQKPLHALELRQLAEALGSKWHSERTVERLRSHLEDKVARRTAELTLLNDRLLAEVAATRQAVENAQEARKEAEFANRAKSEFLANVSHELRTPLNAIIGFSEVLMSEMFGPHGDSRYQEYCVDIHQSGIHLLSLINDLLDLSKIEAGHFELTEETVDAAELAAASCRLVKDRAVESGLALEQHFAEGLPYLTADRRALQQILINLLSNAIKFTPRGGQIVVSAELLPSGGFCLSVTDSGIGIAAEDLPKAMGLFSQVESTFCREYEGTGLGLPLSLRLAELHGGTLEFDSEVGRGTAVKVILPATRVLTPNQRIAL